MTSLKYKIKDLDFFLQLIIYHYSLPSMNNKLKKDIYNFNVLYSIQIKIVPNIKTLDAYN